MKRLGMIALACALASCGGKSGTITLTIVTSPTDDPFGAAAQVRVTVTGGSVQTFPVTNGMFDVKLNQMPGSSVEPIIVEALDAGGNLLGWGETSPVSLVAADAAYAVFIGRPGRFSTAPGALPSARSEMAVAAVPLLGMVVAGGRDATGNPLKSTALYDVREHTVIQTADMSEARAGAAGMFNSGLTAAVFGGSSAVGPGAFGMPSATVELFDPTAGSGNGLWAPLPADMTDARSRADATLLGSGATLITGGADGNGAPLGTAAQVTADSAPRLAAMGPMVAPRLGHAVAAVTFPDGPGAILFGGLPAGSTAPNCERLLGQSFSQYTLTGVTSRTGTTATTLPNGSVLFAGGHDDTGALASGFLIQPTVPPTIGLLPSLMSSPRDGHTATLLGNDVLLCGGVDASGKALGTCDLIDGQSFGIKETISLAHPRHGHVAALLVTGNVLIAGGLLADGTPTDSIEIFTPNR
ncbi:MAG TPA: kelch repeat-containing protein [Polyangia bacterium]|nr:kelch repeat-containing protein [Polyangia bacterium]